MATKTKAPTSPPGDIQGKGPKLDAAGTEHRGVTVLMADIVSSTDRMEALGAEGFATLLQRFHTICTGVVRRQGRADDVAAGGARRLPRRPRRLSPRPPRRRLRRQGRPT